MKICIQRLISVLQEWQEEFSEDRIQFTKIDDNTIFLHDQVYGSGRFTAVLEIRGGSDVVLTIPLSSNLKGSDEALQKAWRRLLELNDDFETANFKINKETGRVGIGIDFPCEVREQALGLSLARYLMDINDILEAYFDDLVNEFCDMGITSDE